MATPSIRSPHVRPPAIRWNNGDTLPPVDSTGVAAPLLVDSTTGRLLVDSLNATTADLSGIQAGVAVCEANLATIASDLTAPLKTGDASGTGITSTNVGGKQGLDVNIIAGGGGATAQYNSTLPTYTSGSTSNLQTDANGRLITTGALTDTQLRASAVPVSGTVTANAGTNLNTSLLALETGGNLATIATNTGKIPALVSGRVPVDGSGVTQPVSGTVGISGTVPVSGTFWQATQPVSLSSLPALAAGTNSIGAINNTSTQFSKVAISTATLTRPANTTAYGANTVVSNSTSAGTVITFSNVLPVNQGDGYLVAVRAMTNQTAFATAIRLHLYKTAPDASVVLNDAAAFKLLLADVNNRIGYVDLSGWTTGGTGSDAATAFGIFPGSGASLPLELASASTTLYGVVETRAAFTPASGQQFVFSLKTQLA